MPSLNSVPLLLMLQLVVPSIVSPKHSTKRNFINTMEEENCGTYNDGTTKGDVRGE